MDDLYSCDKCNGTGMYKIHQFDLCKVSCPKCDGCGKVNWIDNLFKNQTINDYILFQGFLREYLEKSTELYTSELGKSTRYNSEFLFTMEKELDKFKEQNIIESYQISPHEEYGDKHRINYTILTSFCRPIELYVILLKELEKKWTK